jgi:FtsZ-binding cell division protein ZapB
MTTFITTAILLILGVLYVLRNEDKRNEMLKTIKLLDEDQEYHKDRLNDYMINLNLKIIELNGKSKDIESKLDKMDELENKIKQAYDKIERTNLRLSDAIEETESLTELCAMAHRTIEILRQKPKDGKYPHLKQDHIEIEKVYGAYKTTQLISDSEEQPIINIKKDDPFLVISVTKELANIALADGNVFTLNRESVMKKLAKP